MEKKWVGSVFVVLGLVLLVFAVGYSAGNDYTGYGIFSKLFGKGELTKTTTVAPMSGSSGSESFEEGDNYPGEEEPGYDLVSSSAVIPPKTISRELIRQTTTQGTSLGRGQTRTFGTTMQGAPLTGGCDVISSSSETAGLGLITGHEFCSTLDYDWCSNLEIINANTISCNNRVRCNDDSCLASWDYAGGTLYDVTVTCCNIPS